MTAAQLVVFLNAIAVGDLEAIRAKLIVARDACRDLDQTELVTKLDEAIEGLGQGDLKLYRKRVEAVVSKLGHLK